MPNADDNAYIKLLKIIKEEQKNDGTYNERTVISKMMEASGYKEDPVKQMLTQTQPLSSGVKNTLTANAYSHLLQHEELKQARADSRRATWFATAALFLSAIIGACQIYQSTKPTSVFIDPSQIQQLQDAVPNNGIAN